MADMTERLRTTNSELRFEASNVCRIWDSHGVMSALQRWTHDRAAFSSRFRKADFDV